MKLECPRLDVFVPDGAPLQEALTRTTHMAIGAHADDLEIMAWHGIAACLDTDAAWFSGVTVTDGGQSPRRGAYTSYSDEAMVALRCQEQRAAAELGQYSVQLQLGYTSAAVRGDAREQLISNLASILDQCRPRVLYLHNPADAHATHVAIVRAAIEALRQLGREARPEEVYGVEVWRSLDWLPAQYRVLLPVETESGLQAQLLRCHDSQLGGGKRYDTAVQSRQLANATFAASHEVDSVGAGVLAMNLLPLLEDETLSIDAHLRRCLDDFSAALLQD
jgi:LmbE family N-acetylglucosaminyl deacetylase